MRFFPILAVLIVGLMAVAPVEAQAWRVIGAGVDSCGTWTEDRRVRGVGAQQDQQWVVGFLSGAAFTGPNLDPSNNMDAQGIWAWVDNYCHSNPIKTIRDAAEDFVEEHPR
jgi:hypothetical protein